MSSRQTDPATSLMSGELWQDFCRRLGALGREVQRDDVPGDPLSRAEGYRHLARMLTYAVDLVVDHSDPDRPIFHPHPRLTAKWGGDNPDNLYQHAAIDGRCSYRIEGERGSAHDLIFQVSSCHEMESPGTGARKGRRTPILNELCLRDLEIGADGHFEIAVGPEPRPGNWLRTDPDAGFVLVRQYFLDWDHEVPARMFITREDGAGIAPAPLDPGELGARLLDALEWVEHGMPYWTRWVHDQHLCYPPNTVMPLTSVEEGVRAICYGCGRFDVGENEAVILECDVPEASYWQVCLLNFWFETLDHAHHQTSLNAAQIRPDADGRFRLVIADRDPGVPNWLDAAGRRQGLVQYRWVHSRTQPRPTCRVVELDRVREELPADTPRVTPEQRRAVLERRRRHVLRRYGLC